MYRHNCEPKEDHLNVPAQAARTIQSSMAENSIDKIVLKIVWKNSIDKIVDYENGGAV